MRRVINTYVRPPRAGPFCGLLKPVGADWSAASAPGGSIDGLKALNGMFGIGAMNGLFAAGAAAAAGLFFFTTTGADETEAINLTEMVRESTKAPSYSSTAVAASFLRTNVTCPVPKDTPFSLQ